MFPRVTTMAARTAFALSLSGVSWNDWTALVASATLPTHDDRASGLEVMDASGEPPASLEAPGVVFNVVVMPPGRTPTILAGTLEDPLEVYMVFVETRASEVVVCPGTVPPTAEDEAPDGRLEEDPDRGLEEVRERVSEEVSSVEDSEGGCDEGTERGVEDG